jgi:hypothetical protein
MLWGLGPPFSRIAQPDAPDVPHSAKQTEGAKQSCSTRPRRGSQWSTQGVDWPKQSTGNEHFLHLLRIGIEGHLPVFPVMRFFLILLAMI